MMRPITVRSVVGVENLGAPMMVPEVASVSGANVSRASHEKFRDRCELGRSQSDTSMRVASGLLVGLAVCVGASPSVRHVAGRVAAAPSRRTVSLGLAAAITSGSHAGIAAERPPGAGGEAMTDYTSSRGLAQEPVVGDFEKLPSGARYADLKRGTGAAVQRGSRVSLQWVLRCWATPAVPARASHVSCLASRA